MQLNCQNYDNVVWRDNVWRDNVAPGAETKIVTINANNTRHTFLFDLKQLQYMLIGVSDASSRLARVDPRLGRVEHRSECL